MAMVRPQNGRTSSRASRERRGSTAIFLRPGILWMAAGLLFAGQVFAQDGTPAPPDQPAAGATLKTVQQEKTGPQRIPRQSRGEVGAVEGLVRQVGETSS